LNVCILGGRAPVHGPRFELTVLPAGKIRKGKMEIKANSLEVQEWKKEEKNR
jgi:hypothetical protein